MSSIVLLYISMAVHYVSYADISDYSKLL